MPGCGGMGSVVSAVSRARFLTAGKRWSFVHGTIVHQTRGGAAEPPKPLGTPKQCHNPTSTTEHLGDGFPFSGGTGLFPRALG